MKQATINYDLTGIVFNVQRYTVHDGPGTRTELFLKGCPLHCLWCANPEGLHLHREVGVYPDRCIGADKCGYCQKDCPVPQAIQVVDNKVSAIDRTACTGCMKCADECPANAMTHWGEVMTVQDALNDVLKDREFYKGKGGVTLCGGEPLAQWQFAAEVFKACHAHHINTCVESTFHAPWERIQEVLAETDFIIADIKHMDPVKHKEYTGASNELILQNLEKMSKLGIPYLIRVPVIPGCNDDDENIARTAAFLRDNMGGNVRQVQLLQFHEYGKVKYPTVGLEYPLEGRTWPERQAQMERIQQLVQVMEPYGLPVSAGSNGKVDWGVF